MRKRFCIHMPTLKKGRQKDGLFSCEELCVFPFLLCKDNSLLQIETGFGAVLVTLNVNVGSRFHVPKPFYAHLLTFGS